MSVAVTLVALSVALFGVSQTAYAGPLEDLGNAIATLFDLDGSDDAVQSRATTNNRTADTSTKDNYADTLGDTSSTRYAGRVWTDKSVSTGDVTFGSGDANGVTVGIDDADFLVTYSALATSQQITQLPKIPVDVVFVLDFSGSMNWGTRLDHTHEGTEEEAFEQSRLKAMVEALNSSIDALVKDNENNRIGIVVFNGTASTLMGLTDAKTIANEVPSAEGQVGEYLEVTRFKPYRGSSRWEANATVRCNINMESADTAGGTNIQAGLDLGMSLLADQKDTTFDYEGEKYTRIPNVVLMSDGAPTTFASADNAQWDSNQTGPITTDTDIKGNSVTSGFWWSELGTTAIGSGNVDVAHSADGFMALLTAAYGKNAITSNYTQNAQTVSAQNADQTACSVYTIGFSTDIQTDSMVAMANTVLNPAENLNAQSSESAIQELQRAWEDYSSDRTVTVSGQIGSSSAIRNYVVEHPGRNDANDPTSLNYSDGYFAAENADDLDSAFQQITNAITESAKAPTQVVGGNPVNSGFITYTDPIGQYMHVDDVPTIIYAGTVFDKDGQTQTTGNTTTYHFTKRDGGGSSVQSPVYGNHDVNEISVQVTTNDDGTQTLTVRIPASVIPLRVNYVEVNADGTVQSNEQNSAYPLRVLYQVSLNDNALNPDGTINTSVVSQDYVAASVSETGSVNFYSNAYAGNQADGVTVGDAKVTFTPAADNPFYFIQEDTPLYTGGAAGVVGEGGSLGTPATGTFDPSQTYYFQVTYYEGNEVVNRVIERSGSLLQGYVTTGANDQLFIQKGAPRLGNLTDFVASKNEASNATDTASSYRHPTYDAASSSFVVYLGNNGRLSVPYVYKDVFATTSGTGDSHNKVEGSINGDLIGVGDVIQYEVTWANTGSDCATVTVTDTVPEGTEFVAASDDANGAVTPDQNGQLTWALGEKGAGESGTLWFQVRVTDAAVQIEDPENTVTNQASVSIQIGQNDPTVITTNETENPVPEKEATVEGTTGNDAGDAALSVGDELTYTISYQNTEDAAATVTIADTLDKGLTYVDGSASKGGTYDEATRTITWTLADVAAGASGTVTFKATVNEDAVQHVDNRATVQIGNGHTAQTNTTTNPVGTGSLTITKQVTVPAGSDLSPDTNKVFGFTLSLKGADGKPLTGSYSVAGALDADGNDLSAEATVTDGGTVYLRHGGTATISGLPLGATYTVTEADYGAEGYVVTDSDAATPVGTVNGSVSEIAANAEFTNTYTPSAGTVEGEASLKGTKVLEGRNWYAENGDETFGFTLTNANNEKDTGDWTSVHVGSAEGEVFSSLEATATENGNARVDFWFSDLSFSKPGTYTFNVTETTHNGEALPDDGTAGMTYDRHVGTITVTVTDNSSGKLQTKVDVAENDLTFTNRYESTTTVEDAEGKAQIEATKTLSGRDLKAREFTFNVTAPYAEEPVSTGTNAAALEGQPAKVTFSAISYSSNKLDELAAQENSGVTKTTDETTGLATYVIEYTVTEDQAGFAENDIKHVGPKSFPVTVTLEDNGDGTMDANVTYPNGAADFKNSYGENIPGSGTNELNVVGEKILNSRDDVTEPLQLTEDAFQFTLKGLNGAPMPDGANNDNELTVGNKADGTVEFGTIEYTVDNVWGRTPLTRDIGGRERTKDFTYTVTESGELPGVDPDTELTKTFTVTVHDDGKGNLTVTSNPASVPLFSFTNTYNPDKTDFDPNDAELGIQVTKNVTGNGTTEQLHKDGYDFTMTVKNVTEGAAETDGFTPAGNTATSIDDGTVTFGNITFTEVGTYEVTVSEDLPADDDEATPGIQSGNITYDEHKLAYTIKVTDDKDTGNLVATVVASTVSEGESTFTNVYFDEGDAKDVFFADDPQTEVDGKLVGVGDKLTYTVDWAATKAGTVTVTDKIPAGTALVEGSIDNGPMATRAPSPSR